MTQVFSPFAITSKPIFEHIADLVSSSNNGSETGVYVMQRRAPSDRMGLENALLLEPQFENKSGRFFWRSKQMNLKIG
ncbi:hypothetical protein RRG08_004902 [Elysia crispata]|uniref:Uncharacterized protein n=1 Tax=Elysia crispata TaxID=231223 RepID=A0AAE1DH63_9GAST|nr:hypothetical protein RRG08_004902 [Elysia crispata]